MLKQRVVTALLLLALLLPALFYPSIEPFAVLTLVLIVAAGWEWARLNGCSQTRALSAGAALAVGLLLFWLVGGVGRNWRGVSTRCSPMPNRAKPTPCWSCRADASSRWAR